MTKELYWGGLVDERDILSGIFDKTGILEGLLTKGLYLGGGLFDERVKSLSDHFFILVDEETHRRFSILYLEVS